MKLPTHLPVYNQTKIVTTRPQKKWKLWM